MQYIFPLTPAPSILSLVYDPLRPRDAAEDEEGVGSTCPPICHVFLCVCACATFDE